jgi:hypothetical protein
MNGKAKLAIGLLVLLGIADLIPIPSGDGPKPPGFVVALIALLGVGSLAAACGVYRGARWARPLGITTRALDILAALPAFGAGVVAPVLVMVVVGITLSLLCIVALVRWHPETAGLANA